MTSAMIASTKTWLQNNCILVRDDWLQACVEWILEENQGNQPSPTQICDMVYEQWLLADLHELETQCLPDNLTARPKYQLTGSFALQIDSVLDVGVSAYSQLQKRKGTENANASVTAEEPTYKPWEAKPSRMLLLKLTDGKQTVQGMEYRPISSLSVDTPPGTKVLVTGAVLCRHGVLMLTMDSVRVLGGEVDTLLEANTQIQVLQTAMDSSGTYAGKSHRQEFEGTEIVSKKSNPGTRPQMSQVKPGVRPLFKAEPVTQPSRGSHNSTVPRDHPGVKKEETVPMEMSRADNQEQWDDDEDFADYYEAVLDDMDMDTFEEPAAHTSSSNNLNTSRPTTPVRKPNNRRRESAQGSVSSVARSSRSVRLSIDSKSSESSTVIQQSKDTGTVNSVSNNRLENDNVHALDDMDEFDDDFDYSVLDKVSTGSVSTTPRQASSKLKQTSVSSWLTGSSSSTAMKQNPTISSGTVNNQPKLSFKSEPQPDRVETNNGPSRSPRSVRGNNSSHKLEKYSMKISDSQINMQSATSASIPSERTSKPARKLPDSEVEDFNPTKLRKPSHSGASRFESVPTMLKTSQKFSTDVSESMVASGLPSSVLSDNQDSSNSYPFTYLSQILNSCRTESRVFTVKAYISTLTSKLAIGSSGWTLSAMINDGTAAVKVDLSSGVLNQLIGFSSQDAQVMKIQAKKDAAIRELLTDGIQQCQQKLIDLSCLMEIQVAPPPDAPVVVSVSPVTQHHVEGLYNRVSAALNKQ